MTDWRSCVGGLGVCLEACSQECARERNRMMRDFQVSLGRVVAGGVAAVLLGASANASVLVFDNFDYPDGSLVPNGGWANHSGTLGDMLVSGGQVMVQHGVPSEDAHLDFAAVSGKVYYGINFSVDDLGHAYSGTDNEYFAHFREGFNFSGRLDVVEATNGGDFSVGIASDDSVADAVWATDLSYGVTYRAVVEYDQDTNQAQLWIDAMFSTDTSIFGDDQTDPGDSVTSFALRQSDSSENELVRVDGLVVGTSFEDVVNPVPVPGSAMLLGLGGLMGLRRRR